MSDEPSLPPADLSALPHGWGYRRGAVDRALASLSEEAAAARAEADGLREELSRARAEVRYWNDRQSYVDSEVERVRIEAERTERDARERAAAVEQDANDRALALIDRVRREADGILRQARDEAKAMATRVKDDPHVAERRVEHLQDIHADIQSAIRSALDSWHVGGSVPGEPLAMRPAPDFGRTRAKEAAHRFGATIPSVIPGLEREDAPAGR